MPRKEKILVVQTSFLGDVVLTTPLLAETKRRFPDAELAILCTPQAKSLLEGNTDVDEIIVDDKRGLRRGWKGFRNTVEEIKRRGFTMALSPHKSFRTALLLCLARIPYRVGFRQSAGAFLYHRRVHRDPSRHDVERNLSMLEPFGVRSEDCQADLRVEADPRARESVERLLHSLGIERKGLIFGLNPGSVWATKRWSAQGYADLIRDLMGNYECQILLFGGPEDQQIIARIQELSGGRATSIAGKITLKELPCALEWCDVFVTNDSGPMHVAVARGIPVVAVFCATTPSLGFYPYSSRAVVVEKELHCRPCSSHGGRRCPLATEDCIHLVKAGDVLRAVEQLLEGRGTVLGRAPGHVPQFVTL